jgi:CheY-like chemotaxis protein
MQVPTPLKILVVDDNEPSAKTLGWMMEMIGHSTRLALSSSKALEVAKEYKPDVILMDIGMPGMDGYELCTNMRSEPALRNSVFIAQTGWGQQEHRQRSKEAGFDYHLVKPVPLPELETLIASIARKKAMALTA